MRSRTARAPAIATAATLFAAAVVYAWFGTYGTWELLDREVWSSLYDSLAKGLVRLDASVDEEAITWEGFSIDGKKYTYVGPLPAIPRILANALHPAGYGRWSRVSGILSALAGLAAVSFFARRALARNTSRIGSGISPLVATALTTAVTAGFAFGSPILLLVASGKIYHEAILWGLAAAFWGAGYAFELTREEDSASRRKALLGLSIAAAAALLARLTFGLPLYLIVAWFGAVELLRAARNRGAGALGTLLALSPAGAGGAIQLWYDWARFGDPFKVFEWTAYYVDANALGGVFNAGRIPDAVHAYLGLSGRWFSSAFPWVRLEMPRLARPEIFFEWREPTLPLPLGSTWLVLAALAGALLLVLRRRWTALPASLAFLSQSAMILSFYFLTQRYAAELLPLLLFLTLAALAEMPLAGRAGRIAGATLAALVLVSIAATVPATLHWNVALNLDAPQEMRRRWAPLFELPLLPPIPGRRVPLGGLLAETHSVAPPLRGSTYDGEPIVIGGVPYADGLGMHAVSTATFAVPEGAELFEAAVGLTFRAITCGDKASAVFEVLDGQGRSLARSAVRRAGDPPFVLRARVASLSRVVLSVADAGDGIDCDHGAWVKTAFVLRDGSPGVPAGW